jgi:hypothetical protein
MRIEWLRQQSELVSKVRTPFLYFFYPRADPEAIGNTVNCAKFHSGSHSAAIHFTVKRQRVTETHEQVGHFKEW